MTIEQENRKVGLKNYLAYGAGDLYGGGAFYIVTTYMLYYLINVVGLNPVLAGWIPLIGKIWDAINDPLMGYLSDRTPENRFGRRRVWFLISVVPIAVTFTLIWFPVSISSQGWKFFYYTIAYIFFFAVTTMSYVPYAALSAEMTLNSAERNKLNGFRILFSFIATLIAGLTIEPILNAFEGSKTGYFVMGILFSLIFALPWITLYFGTWEIKGMGGGNETDGRFLSNFFSLFKSRTCRLHILMYVCSFGAMDILMTLIKFYFSDYLAMNSIFLYVQGTLLVTMIAMLFVYVQIATRKGHAVAYRIGLSLVFGGLVLMMFQGPQSHPILLLLNVFIIGAGLSAGSLIPHQLLPFVVDVDRLMSGKERPGTYSAAMTLSRKLVLAFFVLRGVTMLLSAVGYQQALPSVLPKDQYLEVLAIAAESSADDFSLIEEGYSLRQDDGNYHLAYSEDQQEKRYALRKLFSDMDVRYTGLESVPVIQKESTLISLKWMFVLLPMIMLTIGLIAASFFRLTPRRHRMVLDEISRLEKGGNRDDVEPEVKQVCEKLTGIAYEKLYPV